MEAWGYAASLLMGMTLGILGGGGAILMVPILVYLFGMAPTAATGASLFIVGLTAAVGAAAYLRSGDVAFRSGLTFAVPSVAGVLLARSVLVPSLPEVLIRAGTFTLTKEVFTMAAFGLLMIMASWSMIRSSRAAGAGARGSPLRMAGLGFMVGTVAGFVGAGGGFLIVPALVVFGGFGVRVAAGTSLTIIAIQSLTGFLADMAARGAPDWRLLLSVASVAAVGIAIGSALSKKFKESVLKKAFGWFVLLMGAGILVEQARHL